MNRRTIGRNLLIGFAALLVLNGLFLLPQTAMPLALRLGATVGSAAVALATGFAAWLLYRWLKARIST